MNERTIRRIEAGDIAHQYETVTRNDLFDVLQFCEKEKQVVRNVIDGLRNFSDHLNEQLEPVLTSLMDLWHLLQPYE